MSTKLRWRMHAMRPRHESLMALAQAKVEASRAYLRTPRWREPNAAALGWRELRQAIAAVVKCGCPRELWRADVQEAINEGNQ